MKFYNVSTSSNYPNKKYGLLFPKNEDSELEYLLFRENERIKTIFYVKFNEEPDFNKWNVFPLNKVHIFLIDNRIKTLLDDLCESECELVDTNLIVGKKSVKLQGKLLHVLNHNKSTGNIYFDNGIYVSELFHKEYKKRKLKGWVFYDW